MEKTQEELKERLPPPPLQQVRSKFKISQKGDIEYDGDLDKDSLEQLLQQAIYYRQKSEKIEQEKLARNSQYDATVIIFCSIVLFALLQISYFVVSSLVGGMQSQRQQGTEFISK